MKIIGLMACDPNGIIGNAGALPWHYPEELEHFRATTKNQVMIMGRKTFEGLPKILLNDRHYIVFSKQKNRQSTKGVIWVDSIQALFDLPSLPEHKICYMIGGAQIAQLFFEENIMAGFILTHIHKKYSGDTVLPLASLFDWPRSEIKHTADFSIYYYINPRSTS